MVIRTHSLVAPRGARHVIIKLITYINNEAKSPRFSGFITNNQYIFVSKHIYFLAIYLRNNLGFCQVCVK